MNGAVEPGGDMRPMAWIRANPPGASSARTVRNWRLRFADKRAAVVARMGERFARMWEFYLGAAELGFLHGSNMVFQLLVSERRDDVPVVRDYMFDDERALWANGH